jgi:hypothetical protein
MRGRGAALGLALGASLAAPAGHAHDGPPFAVVEDHIVGGYRLSLWTDPDATDDGSPGGQFWIVVHAADGKPLPGAVTAVLSARPGRGGPLVAGTAPMPGNDRSILFARVVMDHEGPWRVSVSLDGPLGQATLQADVEATYDTRPPPFMLVLYALPFLAVGALWLKAARSRRRGPGSS